jgi:hypothetical protein
MEMAELSLLPAVTARRCSDLVVARRHLVPASDQGRRRRGALHVARVLAMSLDSASLHRQLLALSQGTDPWLN